MKMSISQYAGFCDGVKRAYEMVRDIDMEQVSRPVFILGSLVHNQDVAKKVEEKGIVKISWEEFQKSKPGEVGTLIITAHGFGPKVYALAQEKGVRIIDATCPKVIKVQRLAKIYHERGYEIVLIGDKEHKEVVSIFEWGGEKAQIVSSEKDWEGLKIDSGSKMAVLSQTTQDLDFFRRTVDFIQSQKKDVRIIDTICLATHNRQEEIRKLAASHDCVVVVGSPDSANSNRLYKLAKKENEKVFFVENSQQLSREWFLGAENIALTAGASVPGWIIDEILVWFSKI